MLVQLKVRKSDRAVDLCIVEEPVDLERLAIVVDIYNSSSYLKSFGFRKVKITDEVSANHKEFTPTEIQNIQQQP